MATYAIGDIQGCARTFAALRERIDFATDRDELWLVGDLVNRGPRSLEVLRWAHDHDQQVTAVLGNHDLHLIARAAGLPAAENTDRLDQVLAADDAADLVDWLRRRPLAVERDGWLMVHAGLLPKWTVKRARRRARAVERLLRKAGAGTLRRLLARDASGDALAKERQTIAVLTRLRMIDRQGAPRFQHKGPPGKAPRDQIPWFDAPDPRWAGVDVVFGHWAALGRRIAPPVHALDSGCVWGGSLTALRLEDRAVFEVENVEE